jgi:adenine-specific DNA methylase
MDGTLRTKTRAGGRRLAERVAPGMVSAVAQRAGRSRRVDDADRKIKRLQERVTELEREIQESRRMQQRVAEIVDVVAEVLIPAADRDDERLKRALTDFARVSS